MLLPSSKERYLSQQKYNPPSEGAEPLQKQAASLSLGFARYVFPTSFLVISQSLTSQPESHLGHHTISQSLTMIGSFKVGSALGRPFIVVDGDVSAAFP